MKELAIQHHLVKATNEAGGFAFKANNRFLVGVPDLYLSLKPFRPMWLEVKCVNRLPKNMYVRLELTPLQRRFLRELQGGGSAAAWVVVAELPEPGAYSMVLGIDSKMEEVSFRGLAGFVKRRGAEWPIHYIFTKMAKGDF